MWEDKILYWAWRGLGPVTGPSPTKKTIEYDDLVGSTGLKHTLAIGVWDDDKYTEMNREELQWYIDNGMVFLSKEESK